LDEERVTAPRFVKSSTTKTPVGNSKTEIERMLQRYGAHGFSVSQNYKTGTVLVSFMVPNTPTDTTHVVPVKLPVEILRVFQALYPTNSQGKARVWTLDEAQSPRNVDAWKHAERVAWRNLVLWIDAALSAANAGLQTITEAFFAHAVLSGDGRRAIDVAEAGEPIYRQLTSGASHD
jgi:hypothetical protein